MKKIVYAVLVTLSGLVMLLSYRTSLEAVQPLAVADTTASTGTTVAPSTGTQSSDDESTESGDDESTEEGASSTSGSTSSSSGSSSSSSSGSTATASGLTDGTYTGGAANTRYGAVQVQITVSGGVITDVQVPQYPNSNREDQRINGRALPTLVAETTQAQSAQIDMVSGATYTSQGYIASLQSAIDQAGA
ncbi:FMN-binding protein [Microbacterium sp. ABRD28]|uniref:FMN-binding protein n=1 Tax=Microbacterium sp. ABRD28 TaxID=2268461 RepID=UPI000F5523BF|nr:FMN-binding protein [Microbacterium sp. ABRD28]AZC12860.1 FMN-binding protein [Microbacterium sp. ABRD28]